jgi:putative DNA primase/helicase
MGSQRMGDQIGTLLAGAFSLVHDGVLSVEEVESLISGYDFSEAKEAEEVADEIRCLNKILEYKLNFDSDKGRIERSVMELVEIADMRETSTIISHKDANLALQRHGFRVENGLFLVSNNHNEVAKILKETPWGSNWRRALLRISGAESYSKTVRFAGSPSKCVSLAVDSM